MASILSTITALPSQVWQAATALGRRMGRTMADIAGNRKSIWPPEAEATRLQGYETSEKLYRGEQKQHFEGMGFKQASKTRPYVCVNLLASVTDLLASRAYGEGFEVAAPADDDVTQAFLESVLSENRLAMAAYDQCAKGHYRGDKAYKVVYDPEAAKLSVQALNPAIVFPEWDPLNSDRLVAANIDQVLQSGQLCYLWRERHELRADGAWVLNKLYRLDYSGEGKSRTYYLDESEDDVPLETLDETAALTPEEASGIDALLVVFQHGASAYSDALLSLQGEFNALTTLKSHLFDKHLPAIMGGPPPQTDEKGDVDPDKIRYFALAQGETLNVTLLEWAAAGFAAADEHLKQILAGFALTSGVDLQAMLPDEGAVAPSGEAQHRQQMKTQGQAKRLQRYDEPTLQEVFSVCCKLGAIKPLSWNEGAKPQPLERTEVTLKFTDGLPADRAAQVEEYVQLVPLGVVSKADANKALYGGTDEDAQKRIQEAQAEAAAERPAPPQVSLTSPFALPVTAGEE